MAKSHALNQRWLNQSSLREGLIESKKYLAGPSESRFLAVLGMEERKAKDGPARQAGFTLSVYGGRAGACAMSA